MGSVVMRCIAENVRTPECCFLCYPWLYIPMEMSSSRWNALLPSVAEMNYLKRCSENYMCGSDNSTQRSEETHHSDPWISPAIAPDEILACFPFTYVAVATLDPLFDDGVFFARRVGGNNGGNSKLEVFDGLDHGFLRISGVKYAKRIGET